MASPLHTPIATTDPTRGPLVLYAELSAAQKRAVQRDMAAGKLQRIVTGVASPLPPADWPALIVRERLRVLAALFPGAVLSHRSAWLGGQPDGPLGEQLIHLSAASKRRVQLPGLTVMLWKGPPPAAGDAPMLGRELYFPSLPRLLLENLQPSRGPQRRSAGREAVEQRLLDTCDARGEEALSQLREQARALAPTLDMLGEFKVLDDLVGSILGTRASRLTTPEGRARTAPMPYDAQRLALFEQLATQLRATPLAQPVAVAHSEIARANFAFLESYFSNFIEGTEFDVQQARAFVLQGQPIAERPKDSHDILGVYRQALHPSWALQTLASGEPVLAQLRARHADQMHERPEVGPGEFKVLANRAGNTEFVHPERVRGTLVQASQILPSVPAGTARAILAMFMVSEVHPFTDGNGRLARLVMNAELSAVGACRIIVPTLFREEYLDSLRALSRLGDATPFLSAMQKIHRWTAAFQFDDLDATIVQLAQCNAFERSLVQFKLLTPERGPARPSLTVAIDGTEERLG